MADTKQTNPTSPKPAATNTQTPQTKPTATNTAASQQPSQASPAATQQQEPKRTTMGISEEVSRETPATTNSETKQPETLGVSEENKNLTVEGTAPEQSQPKERITAESAKGLTIDEINHKLLVEGLDAPERAALEEQKKNLEEQDAPEIENKDGEQPKGKEEDGPFKEGDIIQYMYTDWLIGGANWLWKKGSEKLSGAYFRARQGRQKDKIISGNTPDKTSTQKNKVDNYADKKSLKKTEELEEQDKSFQKDIKAAMAGNYDETSFSPETKRFLQNMPEHPDKNNPKRTKKDFLKDLGKNMKDLRDNLINVEQSSALIAQAQMTAELHADPNAFKNANPEKLFDAYQKKAKLLIAKKCDQERKEGRDPTAFLNETLKTAVKAREKADKNHKKGHYVEKGKEPKENPALDKIKESLGWDNAPANDNQRDNQPKGLYQEAVEGKNIEQMMMGKMAEKDQELVQATQRRVNNIDRRQKLVDICQKKLETLDHKGNLSEKEQQEYIKWQSKLEYYNATGPVSGTVEADKKAQQTINKNNQQKQQQALKDRQMAQMLGGIGGR